MNNNAQAPRHIQLASIVANRLGEADAVLACLNALWENQAITNQQRHQVISSVRRNLVDAICDLENPSA